MPSNACECTSIMPGTSTWSRNVSSRSYSPQAATSSSVPTPSTLPSRTATWVPVGFDRFMVMICFATKTVIGLFIGVAPGGRG